MKNYDVTIIGAGVVGSALLYTLSKYTKIENLALIEKYAEPGLVNSSSEHNSQTLHFGDIETNYTLEKALKVKQSATLVKNFLERNRPETDYLFKKPRKMVLAVGASQVAELEKRYHEFKTEYPTLQKIHREEIAEIEPNLLKDRNPKTPILALLSDEGYTINYGHLAQHFVKKSPRATTHFNQKVHKITKTTNGYAIELPNQTFHTKILIVTTGPYSLLFAKQLGYGQNFGLLPIAGTFFRTNKKLLNNKVYTLQLKDLPFAAVHGDPDVENPNETRFGPTAKVLPVLERGHIKSFIDFLKTSKFSPKGIASLFKIISNPRLFLYVLRNFTYDIPFIGKHLFLKEIRKIVPSAKISDFEYKNIIGGMRPQIVNTDTKKLEMGTAKILGENAIFNITPSPGATNCLKNALEDTKKICAMLNTEFHLEQFQKDLE
ncbi:FAD-dependent oxidoreductase [Candidatus Gracilibacteria bacterium]|nr:FAD-dependent oxidoreductase [Candidatus Gracilibacteria bacterium]